MAKNFWFSADVDTGDVVAKTEIKSDGTVRRYDYTKPDDITSGHGDKAYSNYEEFVKDNPSYSRDKDDPRSINRRWHGNGYDLNMDTLDTLQLENLKQLLDWTKTSYLHTSEELLAKNVMTTSKKLVLKK